MLTDDSLRTTHDAGRQPIAMSDSGESFLTDYEFLPSVYMYNAIRENALCESRKRISIREKELCKSRVLLILGNEFHNSI